MIKQSIKISGNGNQDAVSKVMITLFSLFAELERDMISERTKMGLARARAEGKQIDVDTPEIIIKNIFTHGDNNENEWRIRIQSLLDLYAKYDKLAMLGRGLVRSLPSLNTPMISNVAAWKWYETWKSVAGSSNYFELPLRLMEAAIHYFEKQDRRFLLRLAMEERKILTELLEMEVV